MGTVAVIVIAVALIGGLAWMAFHGGPPKDGPGSPPSSGTFGG